MIGNGVVIDPAVLLEEIRGLNERGVDTSHLKISTNAHLITPYHRTIDKVSERFLGKAKIGRLVAALDLLMPTRSIALEFEFKISLILQSCARK